MHVRLYTIRYTTSIYIWRLYSLCNNTIDYETVILIQKLGEQYFNEWIAIIIRCNRRNYINIWKKLKNKARPDFITTMQNGIYILNKSKELISCTNYQYSCFRVEEGKEKKIKQNVTPIIATGHEILDTKRSLKRTCFTRISWSESRVPINHSILT